MAGRFYFAWRMFEAAKQQDNRYYETNVNASATSSFNPLLDLSERQFRYKYRLSKKLFMLLRKKLSRLTKLRSQRVSLKQKHCGKRFGNKLRLDEHYRAKHGYEKFKCSECDFQSASVIALKNHERRHRGEKPFVCETCGADFHAAYLLVQHRHSHRTDKRFKCDKCPATFKARNSLHTHTRACHTQTQVACGVCARAYSCRHYALKHMRSVHRFTGPVPPLRTLTTEDIAKSK